MRQFIAMARFIKISKIADLSPEEIANEVLKINKPDLLNDKLINRLIEGMISLDKVSIVSVLYESKHYSSLVQFFLDVEKNGWILLTSLIVCQQTYSETRQRMFHRIAGTFIGVLAFDLMVKPLLNGASAAAL